MTKFHIIANAPLLQPLAYPPAHELIALDGAAEIIRNDKLSPKIIIGDLDSISESTLKFFENDGTEIIKLLAQDTTDLDKGIKHALALGATEILISNALGGRLDHTLYNYRILKKYYKNLKKIRINTSQECVQYFEDAIVTIKSPKNSPIAIMSCPKAVVTSTGLVYDMKDYVLELGAKESSCNKVEKGVCNIEIKGSALIIYSAGSEIVVG